MESAPRTLTLEPELSAVAQARRFVSEMVRDAGLDGVRYDAALATSELVSNAVLHAHTEIDVRVLVSATTVRVEVHDRSPMTVPMPAIVPAAEPVGMTGRGLLVVAELATSWGVDRREDGKATWFEMAVGADGTSVTDAPAASADHPNVVQTAVGGLEAAAPPLDLRPVHLARLPVRLMIAAEEHLDDLVRECQLISLGDGGAETVPPRLSEVIIELLEKYADPRHASRQASRYAASQRQQYLDLELNLPLPAGADSVHLMALLDEVDAFCRQGSLLSLAASEEVAAFRRWLADEVSRQLAGEPPQRCPFSE